jgi:hypothetical protein
MFSEIFQGQSEPTTVNEFTALFLAFSQGEIECDFDAATEWFMENAENFMGFSEWESLCISANCC